LERREKLLQKAQESPGSVRWNELLTLMRTWGFNERKTKEGVCFPHPLLAQRCVMPMVPKPHSDKVKEPYVRKCIDAIEMIKELQEGER